MFVGSASGAVCDLFFAWSFVVRFLNSNLAPLFVFRFLTFNFGGHSFSVFLTNFSKFDSSFFEFRFYVSPGQYGDVDLRRGFPPSQSPPPAEPLIFPWDT